MEANEDTLAASTNTLPNDSLNQCRKIATSLEIHADELQSIKEQLTGSSSGLCIIPISGMGGIGKTTLARTVYEDPIIDSYFDARAWVTVSQEFHFCKLLREILSCVDKSSNNLKDSELAETLNKRLKCNRYLIVVDDVWTTEAWDELKRVFPDQGNGSRIIVTTRENEVADYVEQGGSPVCVSLLSTNRSLELLVSRVFGQQSCPSELDEFAMTIASRCQGLPLTIDVIGGVLSEKKTPDHWKKVAKKVNLTLGEKGAQLLDLLALSYNYLPDHLKPCFIYLGVFPEDFCFHVSTVIKLWIAEGFIEATQSELCLEKVAEEYFEDLISRNLVLRGAMKHDGRMRTFALHDLLRHNTKRS